jgi:hypothetical protein
VEIVDLTEHEGQTRQQKQQGNEVSTKAVSAKPTSAIVKRQSFSTKGRAAEHTPDAASTDGVDGNDDHLSTFSLDALSALVAIRIQEQRQRQLGEDAARSKQRSHRRIQRCRDGAHWLYLCLLSSVRQSVLPVLITAAIIGYTTTTPSSYMHMTTTQAHDWYQEAARLAEAFLTSLQFPAAWW